VVESWRRVRWKEPTHAVFDRIGFRRLQSSILPYVSASLVTLRLKIRKPQSSGKGFPPLERQSLSHETFCFEWTSTKEEDLYHSSSKLPHLILHTRTSRDPKLQPRQTLSDNLQTQLHRQSKMNSVHSHSFRIRRR